MLCHLRPRSTCTRAIGSTLLPVIRRRMAREDEYWARIRNATHLDFSEGEIISPPSRSLIIIAVHQDGEKGRSCLEGVAGNLLHSSKPPLRPASWTQANHPALILPDFSLAFVFRILQTRQTTIATVSFVLFESRNFKNFNDYRVTSNHTMRHW